MVGPARAMRWAAAVSLVLHAAVVWVLPYLRPRPMPTLAESTFELEWGALPVPTGDRGQGVIVPSPAAPLVIGGTETLHNVDAIDPGRGGERIGASQVVMLLPRADAILLSDAPMNALGTGQTQRIATAPDRASMEDRRATPNPADDAFLASGAGLHPERRPVASRDARAGARSVAPASTESVGVAGPNGDTPALAAASPARGEPAESAPMPSAVTPDRAASGERTVSSGSGVPQASSSDATGALDSPGRGILAGQGQRASDSARVALGRPTLDRAHAATTTEVRDVRVRDRMDSELLATRMTQSIVESTERRAVEAGEGVGGVDAPGEPGVGGGRREGGRARALGPGTGSWDVLDTGDHRYRRWFVEMRRRIERALDFPRDRMLAMDQGTSVYAFVVRRDGSLASGPELLRSSGFADLDGAARRAIVASVPFSPLPDDLVPARSSIEIRVPIEFSNPMVR